MWQAPSLDHLAALTDETKASLAALAGDVDIKVFSTPT